MNEKITKFYDRIVRTTNKHTVQSVEVSRANASAIQLDMCFEKINEAINKGKTSCYLIAGEHGDLTEENKKTLLNAGYDLRWKCFTHDIDYFVMAIWDDTATGVLLIEE